MAKNDKILVWVLVVIAILLVHSMGIITIPGLQTASEDVDKQAPDGEGLGTLCLHDGADMTVGPAQKKYDPTTSVSTEFHRVVIDGIDRGLKADGTILSVTTPTRIGGQDGSKVEIYYAENSSAYYAAKQAFSVPCVSSFSTGARPDSDAYMLVRNATGGSAATMTVVSFNDDNSLKMGEADADYNESLGASDSANIRVKATVNSKMGYSPYGDIIISAKYNSTSIDGPSLALTSNDVVISSANVPIHTSNTQSATGYAFKAWKHPGVSGQATTVIEYNMYIQSKSTQPAVGDNNLTLYFDDEDWYRNSETGKMEFGPSNDSDGDIGNTQKINVTFVLT